MDTYTILVCVLLICTAQGRLIPKIIGGKDAPIGKYPYQVSLRNEGDHLCGGSIIDQYNILTAAHCVPGSEDSLHNLKVHAGTNFLNESGDVYSLESVSVHQNFSLLRLVNDIALIHLETPIKYNTKVQPIKLTSINVDDGPCKLTGWGNTELQIVPNNLQEIDLLISPYEQCKKKYKRPSVIKQENHLCTYVSAGQGACFGDSGGALVVNGTQIGIVSFGIPCALGYPDIFTRVYSFRDWIFQHVKNETTI